MKKSITWGALVGVALGATITFALSRGWVELPWGEAKAAMPMSSGQDDDSRTQGAMDHEATRPLRPGSVRAGTVPRGELSRA
jgi:hypothetical protein